jgi:hypothetical protein
MRWEHPVGGRDPRGGGIMQGWDNGFQQHLKMRRTRAADGAVFLFLLSIL